MDGPQASLLPAPTDHVPDPRIRHLPFNPEPPHAPGGCSQHPGHALSGKEPGELGHSLGIGLLCFSVQVLGTEMPAEGSYIDANVTCWSNGCGRRLSHLETLPDQALGYFVQLSALQALCAKSCRRIVQLYAVIIAEWHGAVAQWESTCFARRGSGVRIPSAPPSCTKGKTFSMTFALAR